MTMIESKQFEAAALLLISYDALLRLSEGLSLMWDNILFPGDLRLQGYGALTAGVTILDSKTSRSAGRFQFVKIEDKNVIQFLKVYRSMNRVTTHFVNELTYSRYERSLKQAARRLGVSNQHFSSHSARIGNTTQEYIRGKPVEQLAVDGRWKSLNSLRYYINNGRARLANLNIQQTHQRVITSQAEKLISAINLSISN